MKTTDWTEVDLYDDDDQDGGMNVIGLGIMLFAGFVMGMGAGWWLFG